MSVNLTKTYAGARSGVWRRNAQTSFLTRVRDTTTSNSIYEVVCEELGERARATAWQRHQRLLRILRRRGVAQATTVAEIEALLQPVGSF